MTDPDVRAAGSPPRPAQRPHRGRRLVLAVALVLLLVPGLAVAGYAAYLTHLVSTNVQQADLLPAAVATTAPAATASGSEGAPAVPATPETPAGAAVNYLLVGSDAGPDREGARADVIMLVHVPAGRSGVTMVHFPRDMYVQIPGYGKDKINASYAYGGTPLLVSTVQEITGVHVDHVAMIGFEGFRTMTDALGGVDVPVAQSSARDGYTFTAGTTQHMDGSMALTFVRERYQLSEGDISRGERQQAFLKALMLKILSSDTLTNPVKLASLVNAATSNLTVDQTLEVSDVQGLALSLRSLHGDQVRFITAPLKGFGTAPNGASIDVVDTAKLQQLGQAIAKDDIASYRG